MQEKPRPETRQTVDDDVRAEMRRMVADARYAALSWLAPDDGHPLVSRVGLATCAAGTPLIFISALSAHTKALDNDPRCGLLVGEPGKGDPVAHPRLTLKCRAEMLDGDAAMDARMRYLAAHPKAQLYIDLPDFRYVRLVVLGGSFNGGFGRAYDVAPTDILTAS